MRSAVIGLVLAGVAGSAMAAGDELAVDTSYAAKAYYRIDFGGAAKSSAQTVGLRFGNAIAERNGAPAFLAAKFDGKGLPTVMLSGTPVAGPRLVNNAAAAGGGMMSVLSVGEWVVVGATALVFGTIATDAAKGEDTPVVGGTGSGSGGG